MENFTEIRRVIYRHDWQCVAEWASALGELADLTDDEIDGLARGDQQSETSSTCTGRPLSAGGDPQASPGAFQALLQNIGARLRSGASESLALLIAHGRH
jgi:hypothetical protein